MSAVTVTKATRTTNEPDATAFSANGMANGSAPPASMAGNGVANGVANGDVRKINGTPPASATATDSGTSSRARTPRELPFLTRREIATRIAAGQALVLRGDVVLNVTSWMAYHPGGALALLHFVGRDAADEITAYHSDATLAGMQRYAVGRVAPADFDDALGWAPLMPPITLGLVRHPDGVRGHWAREGHVRAAKGVLEVGVLGDNGSGRVDDAATTKGGNGTELEVFEITEEQLEPPPVNSINRRIERKRSKAYHGLKDKLVDAGMFVPPGPLAGYGKDIVRYLLLGGSSMAFFFLTSGWAGQMASAVLLGLCWQQLTCHSGITGDWWWDRVIGMLVADWIGGLSIGWWCDNHDIHHLVTNHPEHDPDIQHIPFFAISSQFFRSLWSTYYKRVMEFDAPSRFLIQAQHRLYYVVLSLARFNLYALSYMYLFSGKARRNAFWLFELAGLTFYWAYFGSILASQPNWKMGLAYLLVSHICASPVHVQIVLSHFACSTDDLGPQESFPSRQLRTTMDVVCGEDIEFIHGGLHLQVTHHLFPRMPRHNLRKASLVVKDYCKAYDIEYLEYGWIQGNKMVLDTLQDVANQFKILKQVADKEVNEKLQ